MAALEKEKEAHKRYLEGHHLTRKELPNGSTRMHTSSKPRITSGAMSKSLAASSSVEETIMLIQHIAIPSTVPNSVVLPSKMQARETRAKAAIKLKCSIMVYSKAAIAVEIQMRIWVQQPAHSLVTYASPKSP